MGTKLLRGFPVGVIPRGSAILRYPGIPTLRVASDGSGDYLTIDAALSAAPATGGAIISIKDGTYAGEFIISKEKIQLIGDTRTGVVIQSPLSAGHGFAITADDVTIETLTLDGRRASGATGDGISVSGDRCHVTDCLVQNTYAQGIIAANCNDGEIDNCTISNLATNTTSRVAGSFAAGVQIIPGDRWNIHDNTITGWSQAVGLWYGCNNCTVADNTCTDNVGFFDDTTPRSAIEDYGADVIPHGNNLITRNIISGTTGAGIESAQGVDHSSYTYNTISNWGIFNASSGAPFLVVGQGTQLNQYSTFDHNIVHCDAAHVATVTVAARNCAITNNEFYDAAQTMLDLYDDSTIACNVSDNLFSNCAASIHTGANVPDGQIIHGNTITTVANASRGIYLEGGNAEITYNTISDINGSGVAIYLKAGVDACLIDHNTITDGDQTIVIILSADNIITNNTLATSNDALTGAILMSAATCLRNDVEYNTITCVNAAHSIQIQNSADYNTVIHNTINNGGTIFLTGAGDNNVITPNP